MAKNLQSIIDNRLKQTKVSTKSIIDNRLEKEKRIERLHNHICEAFADDSYGIGHTYLIASKMTDRDIDQLIDYCKRKANNPAAAFIAISNKKVS